MNPLINIKEFLKNPSHRILINNNEWRAILLGNILDTSYNSGSPFEIFEEFCSIMRTSNIPIDSYFDDVFKGFEVKKHLTLPYFNHESEWDDSIIRNTEKTFQLMNSNSKITYIDLFYMFMHLQNHYNIDLFPGYDDYNLSHIIDKDTFKIISNIQIDVDNTYLIYRIEVYENGSSKFVAYKYLDTLGRIIPNYGYGYNLSEFDKINNLILKYLESKGVILG